ncbi:hypothetical protein [Mariniflexile sp.]|uniref:hypothetical protein n=1 Tax=Mariniflexile sp. TaxID=1979402 RepID=UPI003561B3DF
MRFNLIPLFLVVTVTAYSQKVTIEDINKYVDHIDSCTNLKLIEYDWCKVTGSQINQQVVLRVWKSENQIVKIEEQFDASYGNYSRVIYLKKDKPIKGLEIEENFAIKNNQIDYSKLNVQFKMEVFVTGFNKIIGEFEFEVKEEGIRNLTESYSDLNSLFSILNEISNL